MNLKLDLPIVSKLLPRRAFTDARDYVEPSTDAVIRAFLEDSTDLQDSIAMWDRYSGVADVLQAVPVSELVTNARRLAEVFFDVSSGLYRYVLSGRAVPESRMRLGVLRISKAGQRELRDLTVDLLNGEIDKLRWYNAMKKTMKDEYRAAWIASIGGEQFYDKRQQALFGRAVAPQYRWLNRFLDDINSGRQPMNGYMVSRAGMYARAANAIYHNNLAAVAMRNGFKWAKRILGETDHHCHDAGSRPGCVELAAQGYVRIETITPIGDAACYSNCLCRYKFRKTNPD